MSRGEEGNKRTGCEVILVVRVEGVLSWVVEVGGIGFGRRMWDVVW